MNWNTGALGSSTIVFSPMAFRKTVDIMGIKKDEESLQHALGKIKEGYARIDAQAESLARANNVMTQEVRNSMKTSDPYKDTESVEKEADAMHLASDNQFLRVAFRSVSVIRGLFEGYRNLARNLDPQGVYLPKDGLDGLDGLDGSLDSMQKLHAVAQINGPSIEKYVGALFGIEAAKKHVLDYAYELITILSSYHGALAKRHSTDGFEIHGDPVLTDVALSIFENVDSHGEIEAGDNPDSVSAYTKRKAQILARAVTDDPLKGFIRDPGTFMAFLTASLREAWDWSDKLSRVFSKHVAAAVERWEPPYVRVPARAELDVALQHVMDLDPCLIKYKDRAVLMTADERFQNRFMNETLSKVTGLLRAKSGDGDPDAVIRYVLQRRADLRSHNRDENTFYVCKIGEGNRFKQVPPGMLTVVPGERPHVALGEIWGGGFDEIKEFLDSIDISARWHDLFVATSPSRTADKSNILMIGPAGCGKSQIMRAVGADRGSISVFAQGSDFLTCWLGEAEKNPKRLFQESVRLQKESGKHVFILLDEADSVMKKQELKRQGEVDLTLEFQILMDGVVHYPKLTVVAATNSPGHMPMTMIRRFSKVVIVGELDAKAREGILRHYAGFMPLKGFNDRHWAHAALRLDGATGDVIRKVVDHVWRKKMTWFVKNQDARAKEVLSWLRDGAIFDVSGFSGPKREEFKSLLGPHVHVDPADVEKSVDLHLKNVGIQGEIRSAKAVYKEAHELLDSLDQSGLILSS